MPLLPCPYANSTVIALEKTTGDIYIYIYQKGEIINP
jgi:hypothetical protein